MAHILIMPRQGNTVESCIITDWKVKEGDVVNVDTAICEVETDKAAFEVPAGVTGTVLVLLCKAGDDVPVLAPIAVIGEAGEDWPAALANINVQYEKMQKGEEASHGGCQSAELAKNDRNFASINPQFDAPLRENNYGVSPRAKNLAEKEALSLEQVPALSAGGTGPGGRIIERDVKAALENRSALTAAAKAVGGTVPAIGSGIGGRVTTADMTAVPHSTLSSEGAITEAPIKGIRKIISDRMIKSLTETAQFTINASAPVSRLQDLRSRMKAGGYFAEDSGFSKITVNDLILFAVSRTLPRFPYMNVHKIGDTIKTFERVHLGFAVDTPRGLMVPVIRNSNLLTLPQISAEAKRLIAACQSGSVKSEELSGSTFSITNLGSLGVSSFTPVLNLPEVAVLGVCSIEMKPAVSQECSCACGARFEPHIGFSLTINHQVVDGAPAARFLKALCETVADIDLLLAAS